MKKTLLAVIALTIVLLPALAGAQDFKFNSIGVGSNPSGSAGDVTLSKPLAVASGGTQCGAPTVFASLPASPTNGEICNVTDATACTAGAAVTVGGGSTKCQVTYNGTSWMPAGGAVSSASGGVSSLNSLTGAVSIAAGSNVTVTPSGSSITIASTGSGSGTPGGSNTQAQYNNSSAFGGAAALTFNSGGTLATALALGATASDLGQGVYLMPAFIDVSGGNNTGAEQALRFLVSPDGQHWNALDIKSVYSDPSPPTGAVGGALRDPSCINYKSVWYCAYTRASNPPVTSIGFISAPSLNGPWTMLQNVSLSGVTSAYAAWAPDFFLDSSGILHIFVPVSTSSSTTNFQIYEIHPTSNPPFDANTTWSSPVEVTGTSLPSDMIDPYMVYSGSTYYLFFKNDASGSQQVEVASSSSLTSGYTILNSAVTPSNGNCEGASILPASIPETFPVVGTFNMINGATGDSDQIIQGYYMPTVGTSPAMTTKTSNTTSEPWRFAQLSVVGGSTPTDVQIRNQGYSIGSSISFTIPANVATGDLMIAWVSPWVNGGVVTPQSGWTLLASSTTASFPELYIYYKTATSGDAGSSTSWSASAGTGGLNFSFAAFYSSSASALSIVDHILGTAASSTSATVTSLTTTESDSFVATFIEQFAGYTPTAPSSISQNTLGYAGWCDQRTDLGMQYFSTDSLYAPWSPLTKVNGPFPYWNHGNVMWIQDVGVLRDMLGMQMAAQRPEGAWVTTATAQSIANNTGTSITFASGTVEQDDGGFWSASNPTRLTATSPGWYTIVGRVEFASNATGMRILDIVQNYASGATTRFVADQRHMAITNGAVDDLTTEWIAYMNTGDYCQVQAYQSSGGSLNVNNADLEMVRMGGY